MRVLVLAPDANPDSISVNLISYLHAEALAQLHTVTLVGRAWNEEALRRAQAQAPFHAIETIRIPILDAIFGWSLRHIFKFNFRSTVLTAFNYPFALAFEWCAWRRVRGRIKGGDFDVVLRLSPVVSVIPSSFPFFSRRTSVPFVIGPINGGLPWPHGFSQADNQRSWFDRLRSLYRFLPFSKSTYCRASAIVAGSSQTYSEFSRYRQKLFFLPENGIGPALYSQGSLERSHQRGEKLELIFVGGLVPYKACDLGLRAAAPFLRDDLAHFTIAGDGPERDRLEQLADSLGIKHAVSFCGMLSHPETMRQLKAADVLVFPSVREFGGGVVFEALAMGVVPIVVDFGGPGDIVNSDIGFKVALTNENDVVSQIAAVLAELLGDRALLRRLQREGAKYARERLSWDAKARSMTQILCWVTGRGEKPNLKPPKLLSTPK